MLIHKQRHQIRHHIPPWLHHPLMDDLIPDFEILKSNVLNLAVMIIA